MSRKYDNSGRDQINIENADTINIVNNADRHSLDDWKPSFEHMRGRKDEIVAINIALDDPKKAIACIVGLGGYGKSTLAAKLFSDWKGGRFWADLSQRSRDFREFATRSIAQLGQKSLEQLNNLPEAQLGYELAAVLQGQGYLVVLDNLESLLDGDGNLESFLWREFLGDWANDGEGSKVLITTHEEPNLPKMRFFRYELRDGLENAEGAAVLRDFGILGTEAELAAVSQRVGGIPLSLMFIVGLLRNDYEEEPHVRFLPKDLFGIEGAHRREQVTTEAVFRASFRRVVSRLRNLLMAVSVFAKPFDLKMAAAMVDDEVTDQDLLLLKRRGFVLGEPELSGLYRLQQKVQELVQRITDELPQLHNRAINFYLTQYKSETILDHRYNTLEDIDPYLQVFHHYCELGKYENAYYVLHNSSNKIGEFLDLHGYYAKQVELYSQLVNSWQPDKLPQELYVISLTFLGNAYRCIGQYEEALFNHRKSLELYQNIENDLGKAISLANIGLTYHSQGSYQEAIFYLEQSLAISHEIVDIEGEAYSLLSLSQVYYSQGQYEKALKFCQSSIDIGEGMLGSRRIKSYYINSLGSIYRSLGQSQKSVKLHQQALEISKEIGDTSAEAIFLCCLGNAYVTLMQYENAILSYKKSLEIQQKIDGNGESKAGLLDNLGLAYYSMEQYQEAIFFYEQSIEIKHEIGDKQGESKSLTNLANAYYRFQKVKEGIAASSRAYEIFQELEVPLEARGYHKWSIPIIRFSQGGKWQIALCLLIGLLIGLFAIPLALIFCIALDLWRFLLSLTNP